MPADPWGNFPAEPGDVATLAAERPVLRMDAMKTAEAKPVKMPIREYLIVQMPWLSQLAATALEGYAKLYGKRVTSTHTAALRRRIAATVTYWRRGSAALNSDVIHLGYYTLAARQAYVDDNADVLREDLRRWAEAMQASVLAGGLVEVEVTRG